MVGQIPDDCLAFGCAQGTAAVFGDGEGAGRVANIDEYASNGFAGDVTRTAVRPQVGAAETDILGAAVLQAARLDRQLRQVI